MAKKKLPKTKPLAPTVTALLVCDSVSDDPNSRKKTLYGLFDKIVVPDAGTPPRPFFVYAVLHGGVGEHTINLEIRDPQGKAFPEILLEAQMTFKERGKGEVIAMLHGVKFPKAGFYKIGLRSGKKAIGPEFPIEVVFSSKENK